MTEIPEHLLKRSRERRAAIGGGDAGSGPEEAPAAEGSGAAAPATAEGAAPAAPVPAAAAVPAEPEPPRPLSVPVQRYYARRRIPWWAMPVLAALPLWAYVYQGTLEPPAAGENDPLTLGGQLYGSCASCHGGGGGGGVGPALSGGAVLSTWPDYRDHMMWVRLGSEGWPSSTYGANDLPKNGGMPPHPQLTDEELAQVVLYERQELSGEEPDPDLVAIASGEMTFAEVGNGDESEAAGVPPPEEGAAG
jgi:mono/diheme cytochrome c family protein